MFGCWVKFLGRFEVLGINGYLGQQIESQLYADQEAFPSDRRISICSEMRVGKSRCPCGSSRGQAELEVTTRARGERCREAPVAHRSGCARKDCRLHMNDGQQKNKETRTNCFNRWKFSCHVLSCEIKHARKPTAAGVAVPEPPVQATARPH